MPEGGLNPMPNTPPQQRRRSGIVPNAVMGVLLFVASETMLFAGLVSAFVILRAATLPILWPPPGQPRLSASSTALNTVALIVSGVLFVIGTRRFAAQKNATWWVFGATLLGGAFIALQGIEWVALINEGMTLTSSTVGSFFYLIVGAHALHAVGALAVLVWLGARLRMGTATLTQMRAVQIYWLFVVILWPVLYWQVYLQ